MADTRTLIAKFAADTKEMDRAFGGIQKTGASLAKKALGWGAAIGGGIFSAKTLKAGYDRLVTLEDATARLTVTMGSAAKATSFLKDVEEFAYRSTYGVDQLSGAAANLASYGVESSKIVGYLEGIGEAAAGMGKDSKEYFDRISTSFGRMAAAGRISMEDINTLSDSGVDGLKILGNEFGVTGGEMRKMISKGIVPADKAMDVLTKGIIQGSKGAAGSTVALGGTMEKLRETMSGAADRARSSIQRLGAHIVGPFQEDITSGFNVVADAVDGWGKRAGAAMQSFADSAAWGAIRDQLFAIPTYINDSITAVTTAVQEFFATVEGQELKTDTLATFANIWDRLKATWEGIQGPLTQIGASLGAATASIGVSSWQLLLVTLEALAVALNVVLVPALEALGSFMENHQGVVTGVVAAYTAWKIGGLVAGLITMTAGLYTNTAAWVTNTAALVANKATSVAIMALYAKDFLIRLGTMVAQIARTTAAWTVNTAALVVNRVASMASAVASRALAAATWLVNIALRANPIGLVVTLLLALGVALVAAWKKSATFRAIVTGAWNGIKTAASSAYSWIKTRAIDPLVRGFQWVWDKAKVIKNGIASVFRGMRKSVSDSFSGLKNAIMKPVRVVLGWINKHMIGNLNKVTSKFGLNIPTIKFHSGGYVPGRGELPALLLGGEGVLNRRATRALGGKRGINAINKGLTRPPRRGIGGPIDWAKDSVKGAGRAAKTVGSTAAKLASPITGKISSWLKKGAAFAINKILSPMAPAIRRLIPGPPIVTNLMSGIIESLRKKARSWGKQKDAEKVARDQGGTVSMKGLGKISASGWVRPVSGYRISMGYLGYPGHYGIDLAAPTGTPVHAASGGVITSVRALNYSYGHHIRMAHANGASTLYAHMSALLARAGQRVSAGQVIGRVGTTGNSTGPHLHFETGGGNPASFMAARGVKLDRGGWLPPGNSLVVNHTGGRERVLGPQESLSPNLEVKVFIGDKQITDIVRTEVSQHDRQGVRRLAQSGVRV